MVIRIENLIKHGIFEKNLVDFLKILGNGATLLLDKIPPWSVVGSVKGTF